MAVVLDTLNERSRQRHPEKAHRADSPILPKPAWIRVKAPGPGAFEETSKIVRVGGAARNVPDHGRYVHAGLRVL
jgi:lipoic acid synthetase